MSTCPTPTCATTFDDSCEAIDCLFSAEGLNIDRLFRRTEDLAEFIETQQNTITDMQAQILALQQAVSALS